MNLSSCHKESKNFPILVIGFNESADWIGLIGAYIDGQWCRISGKTAKRLFYTIFGLDRTVLCVIHWLKIGQQS